MTQAVAASLPTIEQRIASATDDHIASHLPSWLKQASPAQINTLRASFKAHRAAQQRLRVQTLELIPLQQFARMHLVSVLPGPGTFDELEWLEVHRRFSVPVGIGLPRDEIILRRQPALLRLMQNFRQGASFYEGSGLVARGSERLLSPNLDDLLKQCRQLDVGGQYQHLLDSVFGTAAQAALIEDKRSGLKLATEIAALMGELNAHEQIALREVAHGGADLSQHVLRGYPGRLQILGCAVIDAMTIQLRGGQDDKPGVILYLPSDPQRALRRFDSWSAMTSHLLRALRKDDYRQYFSQLISLDERPEFLHTLGLRLKDDQPDLELEAASGEEDVFAGLVSQQIQRVKDDARLLLVPTAELERAASRARLDTWKSAGLGLLNLAGLFIPVVGEILLGQLVVQTVAQVYEGAADWSHGHQHEALEHMLGVAETLAVAAAVAGGATIVARGFSRSQLVDQLEPVSLGEQGTRLWQPDLSVYVSSPEDATQQADGLYGAGPRRWMRHATGYLELHRPEPDGPWRVRHPQRELAYGPIVEHNGERSWRLRRERPLEWDDSAQMLQALWPEPVPLDSRRAAQILQVAGVDLDALRAVLVEGRPIPFNLRDTLSRFEADARIDAFFQRLKQGAVVSDDAPLEQWCRAQAVIAELPVDLQRERVLEQAPLLRAGLLEHLTQVPMSQDHLVSLIQQDYPGLPPLYVQQLLAEVSQVQRSLADVEARVPLQQGLRARALLQQARLSRGMEGLYLHSAYSNETGELVFALLRRLDNWPRAVNLELREGTVGGRLLAVLDPQGKAAERIVLVYRQGRFSLYDANGRPASVEVAEPADIFQAVAASLSSEQRAKLEIAGNDSAVRLRAKLQQRVPQRRLQTLQLLGWREAPSAFNPGTRLPDGRVGYMLSGRAHGRGGTRQMLRERLRSLYWGLDEQRLDEQLEVLLRRPGSPFELLLEQEEHYARLDQALNRWESAELSVSRQAFRRQIGDRLRRVWRLQGEPAYAGDGQVDGVRLDLSGLPVRTMPDLPEGTDLSHVRVLVMASLQLDAVPTGFLAGFSGLQRLNLNGNQLMQLPEGIAWLTELRVLRLAHNNLRMDARAVAILADLPQLSYLDMSYNPLGSLTLRFNLLPRLTELRLRQCRLRAWPAGLEVCGMLEYADLRDNLITSVPAETVAMPLSYRNAFLLDHNAIPEAEVDRLRAPDPHSDHGLEGAEGGSDPATTRTLWMDLSPLSEREARGQQWDTLLAMPDSSGLFDLLGNLERTADFESARDYLAERVWVLLDALSVNAELRELIFTRANLPRTCEDSFADLFSDLQVQVEVAKANARGALHEREADLLRLGRQLFRLERLRQVVRQDIAQRLAEGRGVDEVEVSLYYRVHLRQTLDLPFQPRAMRYETVANVTQTQLQVARLVVRAAESSDALIDSLSQQDFWQAYLRERHGAAFTHIEDTFAQRGSQLDQEQATLTSQAFTRAWESLRVERESAMHTVTMALTEEAIHAQTPAGQ
ncbi:NEL-type E3 ubiquitin ligase domain-containing protein [Pseudomonas sp. BP8]|uniref:NEL-type E3 ubiquitin ligase domain-containing protein n=1 Tax=Pseudomonas sp. BP8 TaxID=2817864 RepID=UPI001AE2438E|nr:NEL-type E3 ubiquitin ligase domain-containing protein [Pseudomonas sp. BP8]MBP2261410.1 hypothetical protein [Pseudomonas sp. BP8]HDS1735156.1 hypothetical protein [Pseudomonas putida]